MKKTQLCLILIMLAGLAIRLHNLTYHSLWFDEAISISWAQQNVTRILEVGFTLEEDRLPPLYYLTLKGWATFVGYGEFAVRTLSVFYGVLLIPLVGRLGRQLFGHAVAVTAALLIAINPFLVWYAQEARMYAPAVFWGTLAVWAWLVVTDEITNRSGFAILLTRRAAGFTGLFVLATTAALYSHLYAGFLLPALGLWTVISKPRQWRLWLIFVIGSLAATLAYSPVLLAIWRFSSEAVSGEPLSGLFDRAWWLLKAFIVWQAPLPMGWQVTLPIVASIFALLAFLPAPGSSANQTTKFAYPRLLVSSLLLVPFVIATLLLYRNYLAFFGERYFIIMVPWLLLLAGAGANRAASWLSWLARGHPNVAALLRGLPYILLLAVSMIALPGQWSVPASKEAWRQSVSYLARQVRAEDGILIHPDWVRYPFQYYFEGPGQTYAAFSTVTEETPLDGPLRGVINNHPILWLVQSHIDGPDPDRRVEQWLSSRYPLVTEQHPPGLSIKAFAPGYQLRQLPTEAIPTDVSFENGMGLAGYYSEPSVTATDDLFHPPSGWLHITLYWTAVKPVAADATPYVRVVGAEGVWGASLVRSTDALKLFPPTNWPDDGLIIRHDLDVNMNPATPPGSYDLVVGLEESGEQFSLTTIEVR